MMTCLENRPSKCQYLRINYELCAHNLLQLIKSQKAKELEKRKTIEQEEELVR